MKLVLPLHGQAMLRIAPGFVHSTSPGLHASTHQSGSCMHLSMWPACCSLQEAVALLRSCDLAAASQQSRQLEALIGDVVRHPSCASSAIGL